LKKGTTFSHFDSCIYINSLSLIVAIVFSISIMRCTRNWNNLNENIGESHWWSKITRWLTKLQSSLFPVIPSIISWSVSWLRTMPRELTQVVKASQNDFTHIRNPRRGAPGFRSPSHKSCKEEWQIFSS